MFDALTFIFSIFFLILWIIMVVKFFQIAKNVKEINKTLSSIFDNNKPIQKEIDNSDGIEVGSHVVELKSLTQMKVMKLIEENGNVKFLCSSNNGITNQLHSRNEIELFSKYFEDKK